VIRNSSIITSGARSVLDQPRILCVGRRHDRARLGNAPVIQFLKYDERGEKVNKLVWTSMTSRPWSWLKRSGRACRTFASDMSCQTVCFASMFRSTTRWWCGSCWSTPSCTVHTTQRGDIFLNLHPDRLEVVNPGLLPLASRRRISCTHGPSERTPGRVFHDLKLMEREGAASIACTRSCCLKADPSRSFARGPIGRGDDPTSDSQARGHRLHDQADQVFQLTSGAHCLGSPGPARCLDRAELARLLALPGTEALGSWMGRLQQLGIVRQSGRTSGARYFITPKLLRDLEFTAATTLRRIEPHRSGLLSWKIFSGILNRPLGISIVESARKSASGASRGPR